MADLAAIFKAYDIRGVVPDEFDEETARQIGQAFVTEVAADASNPPAVVVGHDMRPSSPGLAAAFGEGVRDAGADVVMIGLASTDQLYFASGRLGLPGAMFTASHNPARYNGIKLSRAGAVAMSTQTGLSAIRERVANGETTVAAAPSGSRGSLETRDVLANYADYLNTLVPVQGRRLTVAVDAANGMAGHTVPAVFAGLDVDLRPLYFELDGTFPNHEANPLDAANLRDLQRMVTTEGADVGLAFDGDADRCFVVDERGELVTPSALAGLIAVRSLDIEPGGTIIHNLITSRAVPELVARHGGKPVRTRVGHSLIKATMAEHEAIFGGEHSGHYYFRDFWYADSGMLAALHLLAALAASDQPVSQLVAEFAPYSASGEINLPVADADRVMARLEEVFTSEQAESDRLDGLTITSDDWWFNVRPSNTEPLLRLNVEGVTPDLMTRTRDRVLSLMNSRA